MQPKNIDMRMVTLVVMCAIFFTFFIKTENRITTLNEKIHELNASNDQRIHTIQTLKKQITVYTRRRLENKELKVNTKSEVNEIKKTVTSPPVEKYKKSDLMLLAKLIESESGNQSIEGKMAVGTVVMNRVKSGIFPDTIRGVIFQKHQFSVVANGTINNKPSAESLAAAKKIMEGVRVLKPNVLYFYNPKIATDRWIKTRTVSKTIGDHVFAS